MSVIQYSMQNCDRMIFTFTCRWNHGWKYIDIDFISYLLCVLLTLLKMMEYLHSPKVQKQSNISSEKLCIMWMSDVHLEIWLATLYRNVLLTLEITQFYKKSFFRESKIKHLQNCNISMQANMQRILTINVLNLK